MEVMERNGKRKICKVDIEKGKALVTGRNICLMRYQ